MSKVLVIFPLMGAAGDPLYWGPIFSKYAEKARAVRILVGHPLNPSKLPGCDVAPALKAIRLAKLRLPNIFRLAKEIYSHADVCIVNEFSMLSSMSILISFVLRRPTILLVENHARYLQGYGIERNGLMLKLRRLIARCATVILTNNEAGHDYLRESLQAPDSKVRVGPYLTSQLQGRLKARATGSSKIRLAAMGQLIERKGFDLLILELASLPNDVKADVSLSIFGTGPEREALEAMVHELGLSDQVKFLGHVPYEQLGGHLSEFECFVIPSRADYRSLSAFEAISQGFPLLMSVHDGAITEVLDEGGNGYAFDPTVPGQLATALLKMRTALATGKPFSQRSLAMARDFTVTGAARILEATQKVALRPRSLSATGK